MTTSPRLIGVEFGYRFDPQERVAFAAGAELCDLPRDPAAHGFRARIRHNQAQFAQTLPAAPRAHHLHSFSGFGHIALSGVTRYNVQRCRAENKSRAFAGPPRSFGRSGGLADLPVP